ADLSRSTTFREHLKKVREVVLGAHSHQDIPFEKLIEIINPERDLSHQPMFQVMFVMLNSQDQKRGQAKADRLVESQETWLKASTDGWGSALCDLMLHLWESEGKLSGTLQYNVELFSHTTITQMVAHFRNLIENIVAYPDMAVSLLPFLTQKEKDCLLYEWNDTSSSCSADSGIHQLFEERAVQSPDAVALIYDHQEIKYDELNRKANQLARHLRNIGIGPDKTVGVFIDRSPELVVSILGILKAGGAYVPLDTKYPKQRLAFMVEDAQISVIIAKSWLTHSLPEQGFHAVCIDLDKEMIERQGDTNLAAETAAENLAYMIYSSGSTGIPKAIAIRHGGIVNNVIDLN